MARRGRKAYALEQWAVGGRGFGSLLTFLLMVMRRSRRSRSSARAAGSYSKGVPAFYILSYGCLRS